MATGGDENHFQCRKIDSKQAKRKKANVLFLGSTLLETFMTVQENVRRQKRNLKQTENEFKYMKTKRQLFEDLNGKYEEQIRYSQKILAKIIRQLRTQQINMESLSRIHRKYLEGEGDLRKTVHQVARSRPGYQFVSQLNRYDVDTDYCILCHNEAHESNDFKEHYFRASWRVYEKEKSKQTLEAEIFCTKLEIERLHETTLLLEKKMNVLKKYRNFLTDEKNSENDGDSTSGSPDRHFGEEECVGQRLEGRDETKQTPQKKSQTGFQVDQLQRLFNSLHVSEPREIIVGGNHRHTRKKAEICFKQIVRIIQSRMQTNQSVFV